jgi:hypothetical protein
METGTIGLFTPSPSFSGRRNNQPRNHRVLMGIAEIVAVIKRTGKMGSLNVMSVRAGAALLGALLAFACEPTAGGAAKAPGPPSAARESVISCYAGEYQRTEGKPAPIDDKERTAADEMLSRYDNRAQRACGAVKAALAGSLCGLPKSLESIVMCERRQSQARNNPVNPNQRANITERVRARERQQLQTGDQSSIGW